LLGLGAVAAASLYRFTDLFVKHYPPTPYDDLLARLVDREQAARLGAAVQGAPDTPVLATRLRVVLGRGGLAAAAQADIAVGRMAEADGWVLPQSVLLLAAVAARLA
jgi:hypothetical protein